jgi:hypothetical protein
MMLPPNIWWLLEVRVPEGASTPYECWIVWHHQWLLARGLES